MKTIFKKSRVLCMGAALGLLAISSCTKQFDAFNTNPNLVTKAQAGGDFQYIGGFIPVMQQNIFSPIDYVYQLQQNLNADVYSGYMMSGDPFGGPNNTNYFMKSEWNTTTFDQAYGNIMNGWATVKSLARPQDQHFVAIALILKVEGMHRVTDVYGPLPYSKYASNAFAIPYDSQQAIYTRFFSELDTAVNILTAYVKDNPGAKPLAPFDTFYGGDYKEWLKFANSLRLRLAMRLAYADPATAKTQAEKAAADPNGLLSTVADGAYLNMVNGLSYQNPIWNITNAYGDIDMGAPMESILKGYNDPRISNYFLTSTAVPGTQKGIRNGINISSGSQYAGFSLINDAANTPILIMVASESYFLKAEGALRGWNMGSGTAQSFYNQGVAVAFQEKGVNMPAGYLSDATSTAAPYVDPTNATNSVGAGSPYLNNITIAWNLGDPFEKSLQRIITQKWIAMFPDGEEAWAEYRRTGYPKLFPVVVNNSGGTIPTIPGIRRLPFPADEVTNNPTGVQSGITELGGPDNGGTKLWWDKNPNH
ncbi:RagB/SusD family nutrient uptake outer membrane protein [Mucilaginibacter sp. McL0603]|uniref:RagB/SusD family nutrient uptake outer membrane protein n=1 Tax=Mucilaginibacter sp. McL0603 TaxID=3415670 RepID=UPI003CF8966E